MKATKSGDIVIVALMAHVKVVCKPNTIEKALALPQWKEFEKSIIQSWRRITYGS